MEVETEKCAEQLLTEGALSDMGCHCWVVATVWERMNVKCFVLNGSPHGSPEPRMQANASEFGEPDFSKCMCVLALINEQIISSGHAKLTQARCLFFLIVSFCRELGLTAGSSASPVSTCTWTRQHMFMLTLITPSDPPAHCLLVYVRQGTTG